MGKPKRRRQVLGVSASQCPNCGTAGLRLTASRDVRRWRDRLAPGWDDRRTLRLTCPGCQLRFEVEEADTPLGREPDPVGDVPLPAAAAPPLRIAAQPPGLFTDDEAAPGPVEGRPGGFFTDDDEPPPASRRAARHAEPARHRSSRRGGGRSPLRRLLLSLGALTLTLALLVGAGAWFLVDRYAGNLDSVGDVFAGIPEDSRPTAPPTNPGTGQAAVTFLIVGSDTRADVVGGELPEARSDSIMLARLSGDRAHAQIISIPRDSWVDIPGRGLNKINAAYAFGGPALLIQTVEQLTGVRIDHYLAIGFQGLVGVTDALGGVEVQVAETTTNGPYTFQAGPNRLNGDQARWYVGQRYGLPGGDFDRVQRQQQYLRSMATQLVDGGALSDLGRLDSVLRTVTANVAVDDSLSSMALLDLGWSARNIWPADVTYFTAPVLGTGTEGAASVVYLDPTAGDRMWRYLQTDSLAQNSAEFSDQALPAVPN